MITNEAGKDLIKRWETLQLRAYKCPAGVWTIGYGHTGEFGSEVGGDVLEGMKITAHQADAILDADLDKYERGVEELLTKKPNENEFGAMVSLAFNVGLANFRKSSVLRYFNMGAKAEAAKSFSLWNKAKNPKTGKLEELKGLVLRRRDEAALFLKPLVNA